MELSENAVKAVAAGAVFPIVTEDGKELVGKGKFESFDQAAIYFGGREKALKRLFSLAKSQENHETPSSHPLSRLAKQMVATKNDAGLSTYHLFSGDTSDDVKYTPQVGTPQKGKKGDADFQEASADFEPAKYKGLKKVIKYIEAKQAEAKK